MPSRAHVPFPAANILASPLRPLPAFRPFESQERLSDVRRQILDYSMPGDLIGLQGRAF
ncbi:MULTISPECIES: hypothetical protein [unclassified Mesorhizobium]|uniref:hypothetical protein n=1 Tax=unclassified Mesorhizobium TaxID=325217 RepID=UPI001679B72F|nr:MULTISPECIES: hypothetical protein [unclassified Mesorhizobium]